MSDHNTLSDLVLVASDLVVRCETRIAFCRRPAVVSVGAVRYCDDCAHRVSKAPTDLTYAPAIRRLVAAGVLK